MTDQERMDLAAMQKAQDNIRRTAFAAMRSSLTMSPEDLKNSGYATRVGAVLGHFEFAQAKLDRLMKDFLKKYPD